MNNFYCIPDQHGNCITCSDEAQQVIVPDGGDEDLLLAAHAFLAAVASWRLYGAFRADWLAAVVAAQIRFSIGMISTI